MAQTMPKYVGFIELKDGTEHGPFRIGLATKIQTSKTTRANGWDPERDQGILNGFMAWHSARERGLIEMGWDEFLEQVEDAVTVKQESQDTEDEEDPTKPGHSPG